jgi:hypothetical protein
MHTTCICIQIRYTCIAENITASSSFRIFWLHTTANSRQRCRPQPLLTCLTHVLQDRTTGARPWAWISIAHGIRPYRMTKETTINVTNTTKQVKSGTKMSIYPNWSSSESPEVDRRNLKIKIKITAQTEEFALTTMDQESLFWASSRHVTNTRGVHVTLLTQRHQLTSGEW